MSSSHVGPSDVWFRPSGEAGLLVRFGTSIDIEISERVLTFLDRLDASKKPAGISECLPAYASVLIHFDPLLISATGVRTWCEETAETNAVTNGHAVSDNSEVGEIGNCESWHVE